MKPDNNYCRGETHPGAKLTEREARFVKNYDGPLTLKRLSELLGVSASQVTAIRHGKRWKSL